MSERNFERLSNADPARAGLSGQRQLSRRPSRIFRVKVADPARSARWPDIALITCLKSGHLPPAGGAVSFTRCKVCPRGKQDALIVLS